MDDERRQGRSTEAERPGHTAGESARSLRPDDYARTAAGWQRPGTLARLVLDRVLSVCRACRRSWEQLGPDRARFLDVLDEMESTTQGTAGPPRRQHLSHGSPAVRRWKAERQALKRLRRLTTIELSLLRKLPADGRADAVRSARRRYRSRALASRLLAESRRIVRAAPREAESYAALVPVVLRRFLEAGGPEWAAVLAVRAEAHRANALRIAGELPAALRAFSALRAEVAARTIGDPAVRAEIASLEASLAIDRRRFEEAERLLEESIGFARLAGDPTGVARALLHRGMLERSQGSPAHALSTLEEVAGHLPADAPYLRLGAVQERALSLCDLDRYEEAERVLEGNLDLYEAVEEPDVAAALRSLEGRIALGFGRIEDAEEAFASARDGLLFLGRPYDAVFASLHLAEAYCAAGKTVELERLAADLLTQFRALDVPREAVAALRLLAQAAVRRRLTRELIVRLRRQLEVAPRWPSSASRELG